MTQWRGAVAGLDGATFARKESLVRCASVRSHDRIDFSQGGIVSNALKAAPAAPRPAGSRRKSVLIASALALRCLRLLVAAPPAWLCVTAMLWGAWYGALGFLAILVAVLWPLRLRRRIATVALALVLLGAAAIPTANHVTTRMAAMRVQVLTDGAGGLSLQDRLAIWFGNGAVAVTGCAVTFCEAATETALMYFPGIAGEHEILSTLPMRSLWLRDMIEREGRARVSGAARYPGTGRELFWTDALSDPLREGRAMMALNGGRLFLDRADPAAPHGIHARLVVPVRYRKGVRHVILDHGPARLVIEDTVFWALQEIGWMTPYTPVYRWRVEFDANGALRDWCALRCDAVAS